jgi:hypothetical protein
MVVVAVAVLRLSRSDARQVSDLPRERISPFGVSDPD